MYLVKFFNYMHTYLDKVESTNMGGREYKKLCPQIEIYDIC
jgi:hypothetical protein